MPRSRNGMFSDTYRAALLRKWKVSAVAALLSGIACFGCVYLLSLTSAQAALVVLWFAIFSSASVAAYHFSGFVLGSVVLLLLSIDDRSRFAHRLLSQRLPRLPRALALSIGLAFSLANLMFGGFMGKVMALTFLAPHHVVTLEEDPSRFYLNMAIWLIFCVVGALGLLIEFGLGAMKRGTKNDR